MNHGITSLDAPENPYGKHGLGVEDRLDSFLSGTEHLITELHDRMRALPPVDARGQSEHPSAESEYFKKEELVRKLKLKLKALHEYHAAVEQEVERCRHNLLALSNGAELVRLIAVGSRIRKAESSQEADARRATGQLRRIQEMIPAVERALEAAATKRFPGREPREHLRFGVEPGAQGAAHSPISALAPENVGSFGSTKAPTFTPTPLHSSEKGLDPGLKALLSMGSTSKASSIPFHGEREA